MSIDPSYDVMGNQQELASPGPSPTPLDPELDTPKLPETKPVRISQTEDDGADIVPQTTIDPQANSRARCLANAAGAVLKQRNANYGNPEDNFLTIAQLWTPYLQRRGLLEFNQAISRVDVAALIALVKLARIAQTPSHEDSWTDLAGYAACGLASSEADEADLSFDDATRS